MRFKIPVIAFGFIMVLSGFTGSSYGLDKWNILLANLRDLSQAKDKNTGVTIQKSISGQLQKQTGFNLVQSKTNVVIGNFQSALNTGRVYKADIILYGDYYIEGEDLVIVVDVFDVLENRLKMRKYYSGAVDLDIFDTIDAMAADMVKKIKEALPEMNAENQVRIRQVRQNIYETEKISIKRMFYTRVGFITEMGPKQIYKITSDNLNPEHSFPDDAAKLGLGNQFNYSSIPIGLALRVWEIRLDLLISGIPGVPQIGWQNADYATVNSSGMPGNIFMMQFSFYLPWFNNSLAIGLGTFDITKFSFIEFKKDTSGKYFDWNSLGGSQMPIGLSFGLIWNPNPDLELSLSVIPFMTGSHIYDNISSTTGTYFGTVYQLFNRDFPAVTLGGIYFLGNFGLEVRAFVDSFHYTEFTLLNGVTNYNEGGATYENTTAASLYAGIVYRVDFLK